MAVDSMLVDTLVAEANFRLTGSQTIDTGLDASLRRALDWALRDFVRCVQPQSFETSATVSLTQGTTDYDLADDFDLMLGDGVRFNATPFEALMRLSRAQYDRFNFASNTAESRPTHYILLGRNASTRAVVMRLHPIPPTTSVLVRYNYRGFPAKIHDSTLGGGTLIDPRFPPNHWWDLVDGALTKFSNLLRPDQISIYTRNFAMAKDTARGNASLAIGEGLIPDNGGDEYDDLDSLMNTRAT